MKFDQDFIEKVRESSDIVQETAQFTELKAKGTEFTGLCPFPDHNEKSPSFSVSSTKQVYHCFGCKKSGNVFTILQHLKGLSFPETIEYLAKKASIPIPETFKGNYQNKETHKKETSLAKVNDYVAHFYHQKLKQLRSDDDVNLYLKHRGITEELVDKFKIGYAPDSWSELTSFLISRNVPLKLAEELGLIRKNKTGTSHYDVFRQRLMFSIYNHKGECIGFGGRVLGEGQPKYYNSPESKLFNKGHIFYGLFETAKYIRSAGYVIVVEGYMDLIALYKAGFKNVVATLGTALTPYHAKLLKRYTQDVLVLFDGDEAGQKAMERSLPLLLKESLLPKGLVLRDGLDPDDYIKKYGVEALKQEVEVVPDLFNVVFQKKLAHYHGGAADKVTVLDKMSPHLAEIQDQRLKELYIYDVSEALQVKEDWVKRSLFQFVNKKQGLRPQAQESHSTFLKGEKPSDIDDLEIIKVSNPNKMEMYLLNIALMREDLLEKIIELNLLEQFSHTQIKKIFIKAIEFYRQMPNKFDNLTALLGSIVQPAAVLSLQLDPILKDTSKEEMDKLFKDCVRKVKEAHIRDRSKKLVTQLKSLPAHQQKEELEKLMSLQKDKMSLRLDKE